MLNLSSSLFSAIMSNATMVSSHMSAAAQAGREKAIQKALDERYAAEQRIIDKQNEIGRREQSRVYAQTQANMYRLSVSQMMDAQAQAQEYELMAQDYLNAAGYKRARMGSAYSRSGALLAGSALARTAMNNERASAGAARLRRAAEYALERGKMLSTITKESAVKPSFVPIPDAIKQSYVAPFAPSSSGGGGSGSGSGSSSSTNWDTSQLETVTTVQDVQALSGGSTVLGMEVGTVDPNEVANLFGGKLHCRPGSGMYSGMSGMSRAPWSQGHIGGDFDWADFTTDPSYGY